MPAGRPHALADPEFAYRVAECFHAGLTRDEMCTTLGVKDPNTITRWRRDPRVSTLVNKMIQDRVLEVTRKVDGEIARRMQNPQDLTIKDLIDLRKEFLGGQLRDKTTEVDEATVNEAMALFDSDPEAAQELRELLAKGASGMRRVNKDG